MEDDGIPDNEGVCEVTDSGLICLDIGLKVNLLELALFGLFTTLEVVMEVAVEVLNFPIKDEELETLLTGDLLNVAFSTLLAEMLKPKLFCLSGIFCCCC